MTPHTHITPIHLLAACVAVMVIFGTIHLLSYSHDNRLTRAFAAMGF